MFKPKIPQPPSPSMTGSTPLRGGFATFQSGRPGRVAGTRELVVTGTPYVAAYQVTRETVRILRVLHGAQQWPDDLSDG